MEFSKWKALASIKLSEILRKYEKDEKKRKDLIYLINKLERLKKRDLGVFICDIIKVIDYDNIEELYEIIPSVDQVIEWYSEKGEE
ncbi:MAG: hypothetical protein NO475_03625 [Candidatus Methanomethylicia archaeon]|nr:hypothetical protein [Candidatus Methanomethylicia archaeon]